MAAEDVETNGDDNELDEEESVLSQDSQYKRVANSGSKKDSDDFEKREKNVKRRVYDALNVLYAAGVLKKEGKYVSCNSDEIDTFPPPLSDNTGKESRQDMIFQEMPSKSSEDHLMTEIEMLQQ